MIISGKTLKSNSFNPLRFLIISLIAFYQKYLSPRKGFSCAYRVYHKELSCSGYIKNAFYSNPLTVAYSLSRLRLKDCKEANRLLRIELKKDTPENQGKKTKKKFFRKKHLEHADGVCDIVDCGFDGIDCAGGDFFDCGGCDCSL